MTDRILDNTIRLAAFAVLCCAVWFLASRFIPAAEPVTVNVGNQAELHEFRLAASVTRVIDGDTFVADIALPYRLSLHDERVRILGIDAPEKVERDKWEDSKRYLENLLSTHDMDKKAPGYQVELVVREDKERDDFGRTLAQVYGAKGFSFSLAMLRGGKAVEYEWK